IRDDGGAVVSAMRITVPRVVVCWLRHIMARSRTPQRRTSLADADYRNRNDTQLITFMCHTSLNTISRCDLAILIRPSFDAARVSPVRIHARGQRRETLHELWGSCRRPTMVSQSRTRYSLVHTLQTVR